MTAIHQLVAGYTRGDAISNESRVLQALFRSWGCRSEIYCETKRILPELRKEARDLAAAAADITDGDIVILHLSIGSEANLVFPALKGRKVIVYHNITPSAYFRGLQDQIAHLLARGREQARALAGAAEITLADSQFNADELLAMGYPHVQVMPLLLDPGQWDGPLDKGYLAKLKDGRLNLLFVGRCAPNKRIEDLLFALYYLQRYVEPNARLIHVGSSAGLERYQALLRTKVRELGLDQVIFAGSIPPRQLRAAFAAADVFLCLSEHEGFCIPLLEAMASNVPVVAYDAGAVRETLDGAGVLIGTKDFALIGELIGRIHRDAEFRTALLRGQQARLARYDRNQIEQRWRTTLSPWMNP